MSKPNTSSTVVVEDTSNVSSLVPEVVTNVYQGFNALARTFRTTCESSERLVKGVDELATLALGQQKLKLRTEFEKAGGVIPLPEA